MDSVKVSVILPVYNVQKYIKRAVDSILAQTIQDFEIFLVNDGSTDESGAICDRIAEGDPRIKVIHKKNGGVGSARNAALDLANGTYIYFMDPDDSIYKDLLGDNIRIAEEYDCDEVIFGYVNEICNRNDITIQRNICLHYLKGLYDTQDFENAFISYTKNVAQVVWNRVYHRRVVENVRFNEKCTAEDAKFNLDIINNGITSVYFNNKAYYTYYGRENSLMNKYNPNRFDNEIDITDRMWKIAEKWGKLSELENYFLYKYLETMLNEYNNMTMRDCKLKDKEIIEKIKTFFNDERIVKATKKLKPCDIPYISSRICFILTKKGHYHTALIFRRVHTPISRFLHRLLTLIKKTK